MSIRLVGPSNYDPSRVVHPPRAKVKTEDNPEAIAVFALGAVAAVISVAVVFTLARWAL